MAYWRAAILCSFLFIFVSSQSANMKVSNRNAPDVYKSEPIGIECEYTLANPDAASTITLLGVNLGDEYAGCVFTKIPSGVSVANHASPDLPLEGEPGERCKQVYDSLSTTGKATVSFTLLTKLTGDYKCATWGSVAASTAVSEPFSISELYEIPSAPVTGSIAAGAAFYEGNDVNFVCTSTGGVPIPEWNYTRNGEYVDSDGINFVASQTDGQVVLACEDMAHESWAGDSSLVSYEATVNVYFLSAPMAEKNMTHKPGYSYDLKCNTVSNLPGGDSLIYTWYRNNMEMVDEKDSVIKVEQEDNATSDALSCRAMSTDSNLKPVTIRFNVEWTAEALTPTEPTPSPATKPPPKAKPSGGDNGGKKAEVVDDGNMTTIIIIVVVVILVVVILIIIVALIVRRRSQQGSADTTKKDNRAESKDVEQGKTDGATDKDEQEKLIPNKPEDTTPKEEITQPNDEEPVKEQEKEQKEE